MAMDKKSSRPNIFAHYDVARARQAFLDSALAPVDRQVLQADLRAEREQKSTDRLD